MRDEVVYHGVTYNIRESFSFVFGGVLIISAGTPESVKELMWNHFDIPL
jgi:hypothetical protein